MSDNSWALATIPPSGENRVASRLARYDFTYKIFKLSTTKVTRGIVTERRTPAFPGCIFVVPRNQFRFLIDRCEVSSFARTDGAVEMLSYSVIREMIERTSDGETLIEYLMPKSERFKQGDKVKITVGASAGCNGVYQYPVCADKSVIEVEWLGRYVPMTVDERDLEPVLNVSGKPKRRRGKRSGRKQRHKNFVQEVNSGIALGA